MKTLVLIRHGQSTFNEHYERTREDPGHIDARLTELGQRQAMAAREELASHEFDIVVCSPLTRALQTTHLIFGHRSVPVHVTCRHRERLESSCDVGRSPAALKADFPHLDFDHLDDPWWHHEPDAKGPFATEPHGLFTRRVDHFDEWLRTHDSARIAVVGHGTFFHALTGRWLRNCEVLHWDGSRA
ncbi:histidine phosphatase family protein [Alsobacter sp. R-9]